MPFFYTTLEFNEDINVSAQVGDTVYYVPYDQMGLGGFQYNTSNLREVGNIIDFPTQRSILLEVWCTGAMNTCTALPTVEDFIMFSKDNAANLSSILGYYAEVKFTNNSSYDAELFSVGSEITESSK